MTTLVQRVSKRSLNFANQRKAYLLRTVKGESWETIAGKVVNLQNENPSWGHVRDVVTDFDTTKGCRPYKYKNCGRKAWKLTEDVARYVVRRLLALRKHEIVTSVSLQADLAKHKGIEVHDASIRKLLKQRGYKWMPRRQKRKYSTEEKQARVRFARQVLRLSIDFGQTSPAWLQDTWMLCAPDLPRLQGLA